MLVDQWNPLSTLTAALPTLRTLSIIASTNEDWNPDEMDDFYGLLNVIVAPLLERLYVVCGMEDDERTLPNGKFPRLRWLHFSQPRTAHFESRINILPDAFPSVEHITFNAWDREIWSALAKPKT